MTLQYGWTIAIEFLMDGQLDDRMIVSNAMHAIARIQVEDTPAVCGVKFRANTALIAYVHLEEVKQFDPLRIDICFVHASLTCKCRLECTFHLLSLCSCSIFKQKWSAQKNNLPVRQANYPIAFILTYS